MTIDRRRWRRLASELRLELHVQEAEGTRAIVAVGTHMNPEGIFVQLDNPPPMATRVRVTLAVEATEGVLTAEGEVVDRAVEGDGSGRPPGIGIQLEDASPAWARLYAWLAEGAT
jgi:hypothetical protein